MERGIVVRVGVGDAYTVIAAEGHGYSPDLVHDMHARGVEALRETLVTAIETGYIDISGDWDEVEFEGEEIADEEEVTDGPEIWWIQ